MTEQEEIRIGEQERIIEYLRLLQSHFTGMADDIRMDELISVIRGEKNFASCVTDWTKDYRESWQKEKHNADRRHG